MESMEKSIAMDKVSILKFLENTLKDLNRSAGYEGEEIEFECACVDGEYKIVEKMISEVPCLSYKDYLQKQIEYVEEANKRKSKGRNKVLEILKNKINDIVNNGKKKEQKNK
jgi:hypothetical protein